MRSSGNGEIALSLLRCVAKVTAVFENQYGEDLNLYGFSNTFTHMLPSTGYVVPHGSDFPLALELAGNLVSTEDHLFIEADDDPATDNREDRVSESWYVFPSIGPYSCNVVFYTDEAKTEVNRHSYSNLPVIDDHARDIPQLARNQHLTITTRISKGKQVSFNFEVADWLPKNETVSFE